MDIRYIETFLRIVDLGSFTKTGEALNYAQSTVTAQIHHLEKELGYPLFDRIGHQVFLTVYGRQFLPLARQAAVIQHQAMAISRSTRELAGVLRVGVIDSLLYNTMLHIMPVFESMFPNADMQLKTSDRMELMSLLNQNMLDIIFITGPLSREPGFKCGFEKEVRIIFVCGNGHKLARQTRIPFETLVSYPALATEHNGYCHNRLKAMCEERGLVQRHSAVIDNTKAIVEMLRSNAYYAFLPEYSVAREIALGELCEMDVDVPPQMCMKRVLYRPEKWVDPHMTTLIELIRETSLPDNAMKR